MCESRCRLPGAIQKLRVFDGLTTKLTFNKNFVEEEVLGTFTALQKNDVLFIDSSHFVSRTHTHLEETTICNHDEKASRVSSKESRGAAGHFGSRQQQSGKEERAETESGITCAVACLCDCVFAAGGAARGCIHAGERRERVHGASLVIPVATLPPRPFQWAR